MALSNVDATHLNLLLESVPPDVLEAAAKEVVKHMGVRPLDLHQSLVKLGRIANLPPALHLRMRSPRRPDSENTLVAPNSPNHRCL